MDIVDSINRYLAGDKEVPKAVKSRLTKARDEIVLLRAELAEELCPKCNQWMCRIDKIGAKHE